MEGTRLSKIRVTPLAAESLGARSMCTMVETPDIAVLLDAGISLASYRYNLPPHPIEFQTIDHLRRIISEASKKTQVTTISHYHFDHHTPSFEDWVVNWTEKTETARQIYSEKIVFVKNPKENINANQRQRAWMFQKTGGKYARRLESADGKTFTFGKTAIHFSEAVAHGSEDSASGWVIMTTFDYENERFMFAPDVQGPMSKRTTSMILAVKPNMIMLGGPPLYLEDFQVESTRLERGLKNLAKIVGVVPLVILEHHTLRGECWRFRMNQVFQEASASGHSIKTAAELVGKENNFLESKRKELYQNLPPSKKFTEWMKTLNQKKIAKPPIKL